MPQFESEVPRPLSHDLPGFLSPGRVTTPAIRLLFLVFIFQSGFKSAAMQVKRHHIGGGEGVPGQIGEEEFIDHSVADEPYLPFLFRLCWGWMSCHNDAHKWSALVQALIWTIVERAADPTFRAVQLLVSRQVQASLDVGAIEQLVVFAAGDVRKITQIGDDCSSPILARKRAAASALRESSEP